MLSVNQLITISKFSQKEAAAKLGVHENTMANWVHSKSEPVISEYQKLVNLVADNLSIGLTVEVLNLFYGLRGQEAHYFNADDEEEHEDSDENYGCYSSYQILALAGFLKTKKVNGDSCWTASEQLSDYLKKHLDLPSSDIINRLALDDIRCEETRECSYFIKDRCADVEIRYFDFKYSTYYKLVDQWPDETYDTMENNDFNYWENGQGKTIHAWARLSLDLGMGTQTVEINDDERAEEEINLEDILNLIKMDWNRK